MMQDSTPRLSVIGARVAFDHDPAWLQALARVARALRSLDAPEDVAVQVRIEAARDDSESLARHALDAVRAFAPERVRVLLNAEGVDALRCGYDGEHWPERRIAEARRSGTASRGSAGAKGSLSASVHSLEAIQRAERAGVDFVQFGPIWEPTWKVATPRGLDALREAAQSTRLPVVAVGGIRPERVAACLEAGARGVAVVSGIFGALDPEDALRRYMRALRAEPPAAVG